MITSDIGPGADGAVPQAARMSTSGMITPRDTATPLTIAPSDVKRSRAFSTRNSCTFAKSSPYSRPPSVKLRNCVARASVVGVGVVVVVMCMADPFLKIVMLRR